MRNLNILSMTILSSLITVCFSLTSRADQLQYIAHPEQALAARTEMIKDAQKSIDLAYFIYEPCQASTQLLMEELQAKAKKGVKVRMIMDAFLYKKDLRDNLTAEFNSHGMELKFYNESLIPNPGGNMRSHIKFLLVDNKTYITGGRNMADDYYGMLKGVNFIDRDVLVTGASGKEVAASFGELWNSKMVSSRNPKNKFVPWDQFCKGDESKSLAKARAFVASQSELIMQKTPKRTCENVHFVIDSPQFGYVPNDMNGKDSYQNGDDSYMTFARLKAKRATRTFLSFLSGTKANLEIENWSYMPVYYMNSELRTLREKNIPIFVITNSAADVPGIIGKQEEHLNRYFSQRDTKDSQVVIQMALGGKMDSSYALTPPHATFRLHGKVAVRDNRDSMVSSFNLDPRSYNTNLESMVVVKDCPAFADDLQKEFQWLRKVYEQDTRAGRTGPEGASLLTKIAGIFGLSFM